MYLDSVSALDNFKINNIIGSIAKSSVVYNSKCWQWWYTTSTWCLYVYVKLLFVKNLCIDVV